MVFRCRQCGECCSSMGDIILIEEQTGPGSFRIRFSVTGQEQTVTLDPDKREVFTTDDIKRSYPTACPFLRFNSDTHATCTVHHSRPYICRQYGCFRVLVLDHEGRHIGRVPEDSRIFSSLDPALHELWDSKVKNVEIPGEENWERYVSEIFSRAGYQVIS